MLDYVWRVFQNATRRTATFAATLACAAAVAYLAYFLFGPTYTRCGITSIPLSSTPGPATCETLGWLQMTLNDPAPVRDFRALWFLAAWTIAPFVALIGTRQRSVAVAVMLVLLAFIVDASSIISMGGGFVYAILCGPLLLIALVATASSRMG